MINQKPRKRIRLNKEVLRRLTQDQSKQVVGAMAMSSVGTCSGCVDTYCYSCDACDPSFLKCG